MDRNVKHAQQKPTNARTVDRYDAELANERDSVGEHCALRKTAVANVANRAAVVGEEYAGVNRDRSRPSRSLTPRSDWSIAKTSSTSQRCV